ncbi:MAG: sel1 repeat family protein, partial [Barnesiella sp.]|nr:sel1 repeat family protein [Barnesiella sp.]
KAADQGDATAQTSLGVAYCRGEGVSQDYTQAFYWWRKAAEKGHSLAIEWLVRVQSFR